MNSKFYKLNDIKLIVSDLDGTLLRSDGSLSLYTQTIIKKLKDRGILFSIVSGRCDQMFSTFIKQLNIDIPVISSNGALIRNCKTKEILHQSTLNITEAIAIMDYCELNKLDYITYTSEQVFFTHESKRINKFHRYNEIALENNIRPMDLYFYDTNHKEIADIGVLKILIYSESGDITSIIPFLNTFLNIDYIQSEACVMDISPKGTSKGTSLDKLSKYFNLAPSQVVCFGDYINDISMMHYVDFSFATGNSHEMVKKIATIITDSNDDDGVANAIENYILT